MIVTLTDRFLDRLTFATDKPRRYHDRVLSGLMLLVGKRTKTFYLQTTCNGKQIKYAIGRYPIIQTDEARTEALSLLKDVRNGIPPVTRRAISKSVPTLSEALELYLAAKQLKPKSVSSYRTIIRVHFKEFADMPFTALGELRFAQHWESLLKFLGASVANTCRAVINTLISYVSAIFGLTIQNHVRRLAAAGLKPKKVQSRNTIVDDKQQPAWYRAVVKTPPQYAIYLLLMALTGLRLREGLNLHWEDVNFETSSLFIRQTKNGNPYAIPIGKRLCTLLHAYKQARPDSLTQPGMKLFDAVSANHTNAIAIRRGAPRFSIHDLRRGFVTTGTKLGISRAVIKRLVNHSAKDVTEAHYIVLTIDDVREDMQQIEERFTLHWKSGLETQGYLEDFQLQKLKSGKPGKSRSLGNTPPPQS